MIFIGEPNLYVRIANKFTARATGIKGFTFDSNGRYETNNENLTKVLKQHFKYEEVKTYKCKHCDYEAENKGLLMAHYRTHKEV